MLVNKSIETDRGTIVFEGELEPKELDLVIQIGLNYLLQMGAFPYVTKENEEHNIDMEKHLKQ